MKWLLFLITLSLLTGCIQTGRYSQHRDSTPKTFRKNIDFRNVEAEYVEYVKATLRPYSVLGKRYYPLATGKGYSATGRASWYGQKFHGHQTANGEIYDMFAMTAAHKTLPLPSYVRVINLENGRQAVVKVNDRGPFHHNRIIDLSYAAALKLGVTDSGTAKVKVDVIHIDQNGMKTVGNNLNPATNGKSIFIQVAALQNAEQANKIAQGLANLYQVNTHTPVEGNIYKLRLGPLNDESHAAGLLVELKQNGYENAYKLYAPSL